MRGEVRTIMLISALAGFANPIPAHAHRLAAEFRILPNQQVRIEAWYDVTEQPAKDANVKAYQGDRLIFEGSLDEKGMRIFAYERPESIRIVVDAGAGHRAQLRIPESELSHAASLVADRGKEQSTETERRPSVGFRDVVLGVTALLAVAAFVLSWRNSRRLRSMQKETR